MTPYNQFVLFICFLVCSSNCFASNGVFGRATHNGKAYSTYEDSSNEVQSKTIQSAKNRKLGERMANLVNQTVWLRRDISIDIKSCGRSNAFFSPRLSSITFCSELIKEIAKQTSQQMRTDKTNTQAKITELIEGAILGIFLHELGHAIVSVNQVPITGREEDVADQFAFYFAANLVEPRGYQVLQPTISFFSYLSAKREVGSVDPEHLKNMLANEHSLDQQRIYNFACWSLGSGTVQGTTIAEVVDLPPARRLRCNSEFILLDRAFDALFKQFLKR